MHVVDVLRAPNMPEMRKQQIVEKVSASSDLITVEDFAVWAQSTFSGKWVCVMWEKLEGIGNMCWVYATWTDLGFWIELGVDYTHCFILFRIPDVMVAVGEAPIEAHRRHMQHVVEVVDAPEMPDTRKQRIVEKVASSDPLISVQDLAIWAEYTFSGKWICVQWEIVEGMNNKCTVYSTWNAKGFWIELDVNHTYGFVLFR